MSNPVVNLRYKLHMTQTALADALGVSRQIVWRYETGKAEPTVAMIKKLMAIARGKGIKVNPNDFFK